MADHPLKPATDRRLGGPLHPQLANQMQTLPRAPEFSRIPFQVRSYGVLVDVSIGYPPDTGKLLTCYAPFRRSPPKYCYLALPLDLHVLSLPLAFILSQDQTLLCIFLYCLALP